MAEEKPKPASYCPFCGAKRWTTAQMFAHIKRKHKDKIEEYKRKNR